MNGVFVMKKILSLLLIFAMLFSFCACGKKDETEKNQSIEVVVPDKKTVIMVAPEDEYPEEYLAAHELADAYPDKVVVCEYLDSRIIKSGSTDLVVLSEEYAADETVGAILYARATPFTSDASRRAKTVNPNIVTAAIEPEADVDTVATVCDFVVCVDWERYAKDIVKTATDMGAKNFLFLTNDRHLQNSSYVNLKEYITDNCEKNRKTMKFTFRTMLDPFYNNMDAVKNDCEKQIDELLEGKFIDNDTVLFSTDSTVQSTLASVAKKKGMYYLCPEFPTAYEGVSQNYKVSYPEAVTDIKTYTSSVKKFIPDAADHLAVYNFPLAAVMMKASLYTIFDLLNKEVKSENVIDRLDIRLNDTADFKEFKARKFVGVSNTMKVYAPGFVTYEKVKEVKEKK